MKKQLLTAAVAAAVALPMIAQAGVYGRNDVVVGNYDRDSASGDYWDVGADKMRWGIVGSEDLGNGMKALYQFEFALNTDAQGLGSTVDSETTRLSWVGLEGSWGKFTGGRQWNPSYGTVWNKTDTADGHGTWSSNANDETFAGNNLSGNRLGNSIAYFTPNMGGFSASLILIMDNNDTGARNEDAIDAWSIAAEYKNGPLQIGGSFANNQIDSAACGTTCLDRDTWGIGATYSMGDLTVEGNYGNSEDDGSTYEADVWGLGATYAMGDTQVHGAYRVNDVDNGTETTDWYIGVRHFLSKETRVFAEYRNTEIEPAAGADDEVDSFLFGLRKDWKL